MQNAIADLWGKVRRYKREGTVVKLEIAYVVQLHPGGPWYAACLGHRFGGHATKEQAMRHVARWLADNWHEVEWSKGH